MKYKKIENKSLGTTAEISIFGSGDKSECMLMIHVNNTDLDFSSQMHNLLSCLDEIINSEVENAVPVFKRFFLSDAGNQAEILNANIGDCHDCAVSVVEQPPLDGSKIAIWVYLQKGVKVRYLTDGMYAVENGKYTHLWTGSGVMPAADSESQMMRLFENYVQQLELQGCTLEANAIRTWIFVQNIDVNYAGVVKARNEIFVKEGLTSDTHYIASTGIQGRNADHKINVQLDTYAVKGIAKEQIQYLYAPTHLNPTYEYGVSFERGTCVHYQDRRHVFISGTASIDNKGRVLYIGDIKQQTQRMCENVEMLLAEAECDFSNLMQIIVYLRDVADYKIVEEMFAQRFPNIPKVILLAPVCRPAWLIEMECIAMKQH